jgi:hypothetical protein
MIANARSGARTGSYLPHWQRHSRAMGWRTATNGRKGVALARNAYGLGRQFVQPEERGSDGDAAEELDEEGTEEWHNVLQPYAATTAKASPFLQCNSGPRPHPTPPQPAHCTSSVRARAQEMCNLRTRHSQRGHRACDRSDRRGLHACAP